MRTSRVVDIIKSLADEMNLLLEIEDRYRFMGRITFPNGKKYFFHDTIFDLNGSGAAYTAKDKDYAAHFLQKSGYPVPIGDSFHTYPWARTIGSTKTADAAWEYAQKIGLPVFVKPNSKSQGRNVLLVRTKTEFYHAVAQASKDENVYLVQKPVQGRDYRIVCLDGEVISAYERTPFRITGDGAQTIQSLIEQKIFALQNSEHKIIIKPNDPRFRTTVHAQKLKLTTILPANKTINALSNANLSSGGDARDITEELHPEWRRLAAKISHDMNLRYIGIDIITENELRDAPQDYTVLEINSAPGLDNYAAIGETQQQIVKNLYRKILQALGA